MVYQKHLQLIWDWPFKLWLCEWLWVFSKFRKALILPGKLLTAIKSIIDLLDSSMTVMFLIACDCTTLPENCLNLFQSVAKEIRKPYSTSWGWRNGPITRLGTTKNAFGIRWFNESCYKSTKSCEGKHYTSLKNGHHHKAHTSLRQT